MLTKIFKQSPEVVTAFSKDPRILADHSLIKFKLGEGKNILKLKSGNMSTIDEDDKQTNIEFYKKTYKKSIDEAYLDKNNFFPLLEKKVEGSHLLLLCESVKSENVKFELKSMKLINGTARRLQQEDYNRYNYLYPVQPRSFTNRDSYYFGFKKQGEYSVFFLKEKINEILFGDEIELKDKQVGIKVTIHQKVKIKKKGSAMPIEDTKKVTGAILNLSKDTYSMEDFETLVDQLNDCDFVCGDSNLNNVSEYGNEGDWNKIQVSNFKIKKKHSHKKGFFKSNFYNDTDSMFVLTKKGKDTVNGITWSNGKNNGGLEPTRKAYYGFNTNKNVNRNGKKIFRIINQPTGEASSGGKRRTRKNVRTRNRTKSNKKRMKKTKTITRKRKI